MRQNEAFENFTTVALAGAPTRTRSIYRTTF